MQIIFCSVLLPSNLCGVTHPQLTHWPPITRSSGVGPCTKPVRRASLSLHPLTTKDGKGRIAASNWCVPVPFLVANFCHLQGGPHVVLVGDSLIEYMQTCKVSSFWKSSKMSVPMNSSLLSGFAYMFACFFSVLERVVRTPQLPELRGGRRENVRYTEPSAKT